MKTLFTGLLVFFILNITTAQVISLKNDFNLNQHEEKTNGYISNKSNSILSSGKWIKLSAKNEGVVKLTYDKLKQMGIGSPENIAVYTNGGYMLPKMNNVEYPDDLQKIAVLHSKDEAGKDAIFFYCTGTTKWGYDKSRRIFTHTFNLYSDKTYFYLTSDLEKSSSPVTISPISDIATSSLTNFNDFQLFEDEAINIGTTGGTGGSGRRWFSYKIPQATTKTFSFKFNNIETNQPSTITIAAAARSAKQSYYNVTEGNFPLGKISFPQGSEPNDMETDFPIVTTKNDFSLNLSYEAVSNGDSWVDFIMINTLSKLIFEEKQFSFRNIATLTNPISEFRIQTTSTTPVIWDVTDPSKPLNVAYTLFSNEIAFKAKGQSLNEYIVFNPLKGAFEEPVFVENVKNQNIHGFPPYNLIIVSHPDFIPAANDLAEFHRKNDNLKVLIVTPGEIYNEYSSGLPDPSAIRNMLRHFYHKSTSTDSLRYVLLMGDGSYDNRNYDGSKPNFIPTWQSEESLDENYTFVSDDFYVLLDDNEGEYIGDLDAGIGRFPCKTIDEANNIVKKVIDYSSPKAMGNWRNAITFLADDWDQDFRNDFPEQSEELIDIINKNYPGFNATKIYFDSYQQVPTSQGDSYPEATEAINRSVNEGAMIVNYIGHGNPNTIAHEGVLGKNDIISWSNKYALPIFVTASCEISRFDGDKVSLGEQIILNQIGGGIALFSTTRVVFGSNNFDLSKKFYQNVFKQDSKGENLRMGDIMRLAKNTTEGVVNLRKFALLGDPALTLAFPKFKVYTQSINGAEPKEDIIIGALGKVTIKGFVTDNTGNVRSDMNGSVTTTIYDKTVYVKTLANDASEGATKFEYPIQNNKIYKGTSTVKNGEFEFSFIVPKDISYNIGKGKIFYYFSNDTIDGNGATDEFQIGGTSENPIIENTPPQIDLFLNNEKFKEHDRVSSSALLLVNLSDESGINTVGTGIGHDITAVLDSNYSNQMVLNDFYVSVADNFQKGKIVFPLNNLEPGEHTLTIKAWDVQNISAEKEIHFFVEKGFKIISLSNYPNPVKFYTNFKITHNLPGDVLDVNVELFNLQGSKIHEFTETISSNGTTEATLRWDVINLKRPMNNGQVLIYRVTMKNQGGLIATGAGKLILNNEN